MVAAPMPTHSLRVSFAMSLRGASQWGAAPFLPRLSIYDTKPKQAPASRARRQGDAMILAIADVLTAADVEEVRSGLATAPFVDGRATAGWSARLVKSNLQASPAPEVERLRALVETRLRDHPVFALATRPKTILGPLFSRYQPGHAYGAHVDDALMGGIRSDISFTLFLSEPD